VVTPPLEGALALRSEQDMFICRQAVRKLTQDLKFSLVEQTKMVTATSELARNTLVYGGGGEMRWGIVQRDLKFGLRLAFEDQGSGIVDIDLAMTDGWTSGGGLGLGLSGSKRLVHDFEIKSTVGVGTCVTITRWK
jgi:serine/threonine-protein kinase RsbT